MTRAQRGNRRSRLRDPPTPQFGPQRHGRLVGLGALGVEPGATLVPARLATALCLHDRRRHVGLSASSTPHRARFGKFSHSRLHEAASAWAETPQCWVVHQALQVIGPACSIGPEPTRLHCAHFSTGNRESGTTGFETLRPLDRRTTAVQVRRCRSVVPKWCQAPRRATCQRTDYCYRRQVKTDPHPRTHVPPRGQNSDAVDTQRRRARTRCTTPKAS
jgi:hypothetical protein